MRGDISVFPSHVCYTTYFMARFEGQTRFGGQISIALN